MGSKDKNKGSSKVAPADGDVKSGAPAASPGETNQKKGWVRRLREKRVKMPKISWEKMKEEAKEFLNDPVNLAVLVWIVLSTPPCLIIVLIKIGALNSALNEETRNKLEEISNQVSNALFVLMCLIIFPLLCRQTFQLFRWNASDKVELRKAFCKNGKRKPHDRTHMFFVVFWGQVTCWATFVFAAIFWALDPAHRPGSLDDILFYVSMVAPVLGFLHLALSPLSKDFDIVKEGDAEMIKVYERKYAFYTANKEIKNAEWSGTVVPGCCNDPKTAALVFFCTPCMFGYNMERLGFGHKAVHALMYVIVLVGPLIVFFLSAESIVHMGVAASVVYYCGVLLTLLGCSYGGAWRIKMRETYGLPGSAICCWSKRATDVCVWTWCSFCALCQEIRTVDQYDVEESEELGAEAVDAEKGEMSEEWYEGNEVPGVETRAPQAQSMKPEPREARGKGRT